jgi:integral membrane protein
LAVLLALDLGPLNDTAGERAVTLRRLNVIAVIALADALLLAVLLWASFGDREGLIHVLGPIHGVGFVVLLALCMRGAVEDRWDWWFPAVVLVTGGPPGSLIGDWILRRRLSTTQS